MTPPADRDRVMVHDEAVELVSAYALGVLDRDERVPFEAHLATCWICTRELAEFRRVTAAIALGETHVAPPDELRARVMTAAMGAAASQPTVVAAVPAAEPAPASPAEPAPASPVEPVVTSTAGPAPVRHDRRAFPAWLAIAASLAAAAGLGMYALRVRSELNDMRRTLSEYSSRVDSLRDQLAAARLDAARLVNTISVMGAPDVIKVSLTGKDEAAAATGRAYLSVSRGLIFETEKLPALPAGKIYQLWVIPAGQAPVSAGVFNVNPAGVVSLALRIPPTVGDAQVVAVTVENGPNGNAQPTSQPILVGQVGH